MANYINGLFIEQKEGPYGPYLSIGISPDGLKALQELPTSAKGWRNITATPQKDNPLKYSAKPFEPKKSNEQLAAEGGKRYGGAVTNEDASSDLPF
jgi:hypothetical protein